MEVLSFNETLRDGIINASNPFDNQHGHKSHLARFLFSYDSVNKVYTPILFLFGAIGNCLSVTVFCMAPTHRHLSSSYYLSALAISDTGFLINLLAVWLEDMGYHVITTQLTCPLVMYLGQVTCFLSVWLTVSFTVERFFAVCYPLTRPTVCTVARAKKVISILTLVALIGFSYVWLIARALDFPIPGSGSGGGNSANIMDSSSADYGGSSEEDASMKGETTLLDREQTVVNSSYSSSTATTAAIGNLMMGCNSSQRRGWIQKLDGLAPLNFIICNGSETGGSSPWNGTNLEENFSDVETIRVCYVREEHMYFSSIASHIDSLLTLILPFFVITYLNVRIALCVWKLKDQRQNIMAIAKISSSPSNAQYPAPGRNNDHPSSVCRVPTSGSRPLLNGIGGSGSTSTQVTSPQSPQPPTQTSLNNPKSYRINLGSSTSLNATNSTSVSGPSLNRVNRNHSSSTSASEARVTKTLLLVSTVFLVLNLPAHAIRAVAYVQSLWGSEMVEELQAAQQWANILFNTNFSVNFLLYCLSGRNFRKSLWTIIFHAKPNNRHPKHTQKRFTTSRAQQPQFQQNVNNKAGTLEPSGPTV